MKNSLKRISNTFKFSLFKNISLFSFPMPINTTTSFNKIPIATFAKKVDKNDKNAKKEKEKDKINKEYEDVSVDELKSKYKQKSDNIVVTFKEAINEIRVQRSNPKILDGLTITIKGKKNKLSDIATIMMKAANVLAVNPFDESHKDAIIKGIESSKLDVQISTEAESVLVTLGAIPDDMKNESLQQIKKLNEAAKEDIKNLRHGLLTEMKKLEKILGKDEAKRIEKGLVDIIEKSSKMAEQTYKKKEEEIKSS